MTLPRRVPLLIVAAVLLAAVALLAFRPQGAGSQAVPVREALAEAVNPAGAKGKTLTLARVTVPGGAVLAKHHHAGTQTAYIEQGTLTYTVYKGHVDVMQGASDDKPKRVRRIAAGQTGSIKAGQWIIESPTMHHRAANRGTKEVVIVLTSLVPTGSPPSIVDPE